MRVRNVSFLVAAAGLLAASTANADLFGMVKVTAQPDGGTAVSRDFEIAGSFGSDGNLHWSWASETPDGESLGGATLYSLGLDLNHDPIVNSNFNVSAGAFNTTFVIDSVILAFPTIGMSEAYGRASAQVGVSSLPGLGTPGVTFTGLQGGGNAYSAFFNAPPSPTGPSGALFANLLTGGSSPGAQSYIESTGSGYLPLGTSVSDISSQFRFSLSPFDRASGSSVFEVIPAPGTLALLGLGGFVAGRRRRV